MARVRTYTQLVEDLARSYLRTHSKGEGIHVKAREHSTIAIDLRIEKIAARNMRIHPDFEKETYDWIPYTIDNSIRAFKLTENADAIDAMYQLLEIIQKQVYYGGSDVKGIVEGNRIINNHINSLNGKTNGS